MSLRERLALAACYALVFVVLPALLIFPPAHWRVFQ
jgi:hypothetical protein